MSGSFHRWPRPRGAAFVGALAVVALSCTPSAPVDDADPQGTLTTGIDQEPNLDPATTGSPRDLASLNMVFEPLLQFDPRTRRLLPAAAKALPELSADGLTYKVQVRDDEKFSDGTPVRAKDFAYSFTRFCDPSINFGSATFTSAIVGCAEWNQMDPKKAPPETLRAAKEKLTATGIRAMSDKELTITLTRPASYFASILALWIGVPVRDSDVAHGGEQWTDPATYIGNGPFVLSSWKHNERLVFTPNRSYRSPARLKQWTKLVIVEPRVALDAYRHDEVDAMTFGAANVPSLDEIQSDPVLKRDLIVGTTGCTGFLGFNARRAPFDDANVRLAFAKSIDREAYVRDIGRPGAPATSWIAPGLPGYDPADTTQRFDPAEARRLLASSRYAGTDALRSIVIPQNLLVGTRVRNEWLRDQWRTNLGVDVRLEQMEGRAIQQLFNKPETTPQIWGLDGFCADYPDQHDFLTAIFHSSVKDGWRVFAGFADPEFDRLVEQADVERDQARRDDLYQRASRILSDRAVLLFLFTGGFVSMRKPWVKGITAGAFNVYPGGSAAEQVFVTRKGG